VRPEDMKDFLENVNLSNETFFEKVLTKFGKRQRNRLSQMGNLFNKSLVKLEPALKTELLDISSALEKEMHSHTTLHYQYRVGDNETSSSWGDITETRSQKLFEHKIDASSLNVDSLKHLLLLKHIGTDSKVLRLFAKRKTCDIPEAGAYFMYLLLLELQIPFYYMGNSQFAIHIVSAYNFSFLLTRFSDFDLQDLPLDHLHSVPGFIYSPLKQVVLPDFNTMSKEQLQAYGPMRFVSHYSLKPAPFVPLPVQSASIFKPDEEAISDLYLELLNKDFFEDLGKCMLKHKIEI
jgi:hypothetical protein